jgi:hypothetical protein
MNTPDDSDDDIEVPKLIQCADGKWAPWVVVCRHLLDGEADEWFQLPQPDGGEVFDYMCRECFLKGPDNVGIDDLRACCFHCIRREIEERGIVPIDLGDDDP